ncbi:MAG: hypothetical protein LUC30_10555 [Clostridiales bacterium]|nr:hypothetical protein [Clostridiales bacterium]
MKMGYEKPMIEFEEYQLSTAIASCETYVSLAPEEWTYKGTHYGICEEYIQTLSDDDTYTGSGPWFEGSCSCYLSSGNSTFLNS